MIKNEFTETTIYNNNDDAWSIDYPCLDGRNTYTASSVGRNHSIKDALATLDYQKVSIYQHVHAYVNEKKTTFLDNFTIVFTLQGYQEVGDIRGDWPQKWDTWLRLFPELRSRLPRLTTSSHVQLQRLHRELLSTLPASPC